MQKHLFLLMLCFAITPLFAQTQTNTTVATLYAEGVKAYKAHDFKTALKNFDKAIIAQPNYWEAYFNRAQIFVLENKLPQALTDFEAAIKYNPKDATMPYNLGVLLAKTNKWEEATAAFSRAIKLDKTYAAAYSNRAEGYRITKR
jgi:Tfp pilus assembly protein PilF